jgi:hypothetical protein
MTVTLYVGCFKDEILEPAVDFHTAPSLSNGNAPLVLEMLASIQAKAMPDRWRSIRHWASCVACCAPTSTGHPLHGRRA